MKTNFPCFLLLLLCSATLTSRAQLVPDGGTATINGINTNVSGTVTIGSNGTNTTLIITNAGTLTNTGFGNIGLNTGSKSNQVIITGANSVWSMAQNLNLGQDGGLNRLVLTNGGLVQNSAGHIGRFSDGTNNLALVTGPNSLWKNGADLLVGEDGSFNQLVATNSGTVVSSNLYVGLNAAGSNNTVTLSGGNVFATNAFGTGVTDVRHGSVVMNSGLLVTDQLLLTNGTPGQLNFNGGTMITRGGIVSNSLSLVAGVSLSAVPTPAVLDVRAGQPLSLYNALILGSTSSSNRLYITNGGIFNVQSVSGVTLGNNTLSTGNGAVVSGSGSLWSNTGPLNLGFSSGLNFLVISNGGTLVDGTATVGVLSTANTNQAILSGSGSLWRNTGNLVIGSDGSGNALIITNGGTATNTVHGQIGVNSSARSNLVVVTGTNSSWGVAQTLFLGSAGSQNQLLVTNAGRIWSLYGLLGSTGGNSNSAIVTGTNSVWHIDADLQLGSSGSHNQVLATGGGKLESYDGLIGANAIASGTGSSNSVVVAGAGSQWSLLFSLIIGNLGSGNQLIVTNGGTVTASTNFVSLIPSGRSNSVFVADPNSLLAISQDLFVGADGSYGQLVVSNSGTVSANRLILGNSAASSNNTATLSGGNLITTNVFANGFIDVRRGSLTLNTGWLGTDNLFLTNGAISQIAFNGGLLQTRATVCSNGSPFAVGDGASAAILELLGSGTHTFANGLQLNNNATLKGNGTITGNVTIASGGTLTPGASVGRFTITGSLTLAAGSINIFELNRGAGTNDNIIGLTSLTMGGTLQVANLSGVLTNGDTFKLFNAGSYLGTFGTLSLPALAPGLGWSNRLSLDGSLQVITIPVRDLGVDVSHFQGATGVAQSSWDQMYSEGKRFTFIKASEGLTGPDDAAMSNNVSRATASGLLVGVYHYAHPENRTNATGGVQEADHLLSYAGSAVGPGRLRPVLDLESSASSLTTTGLTVWVMAFSDRIKALRGSGAAPILYMNQSFANNEVDNRLAGCDLWLAYYTNVDVSTAQPPPTAPFPNPLGVFTNWAFWQYSSTGTNGGITPLDEDVCHSEYKSLASYIIPTPSSVFAINSLSLGGGAFQFSFTNVPGTHFTVLAATNLTLPLSNWIALTNVTEVSPGRFQFTDPQAPNSQQRFYRVRSP